MNWRDPDAHVIVLSDHGFESGRFRPLEPLGSALDNPLRWHRSHGVFCMAGPGIRRDELVYGAGLLDIGPTVLTMFGLKPGADMPGRVLSEAFEKAPGSERIASWEIAEADVERAVTPEAVWDAAAVLAQLAALGYIDAAGQESGEQLKKVQADRDFNLAKIHLSAGRYVEAIALFDSLAGESGDPPNSAYLMYLAHCYSRAGRLEECRLIAGQLLARDAEGASANVIRGNLALMEGDVESGLAYLLKAEACWEKTPHLQHLIGRVYLQAGMWAEAERLFRKVIEFDADAVESHAGLARCLLERGFPKESRGGSTDSHWLEI